MSISEEMDTAEKIMIFSFFLQGVCCRDFSISLPEKIEALSGSCVIIKCRFEINETYDKDLTERAAGIWHKDGHNKNNNQVFISNASTHNYLITGNITGQLKEKDCTTVFYDVRLNHTGQYFFRIEGEGGLKWTYRKTYVSINVIESPVKPRVQLYEDQKELQDQLEVLEGRSVSLRCSAEALCSSLPPTLTWSSTPKIPLSQSSKLQELIISDLNFTASRHDHNATFTCSISYQLQDSIETANSSITLHVQYAPQISNSSSCNSTDITVCFCEVDGNPSPEVQWLLSGHPVSNSSNMFISEERLNSTGLRSFISLHQSLANTNTLMCFSNNTHGHATKQFHLVFVTQKKCWNLVFVLIGVAAVALVIAMLCAITAVSYTHVRTNNGKLLQATQEGGARGSGQNAEEVSNETHQHNWRIKMTLPMPIKSSCCLRKPPQQIQNPSFIPPLTSQSLSQGHRRSRTSLLFIRTMLSSNTVLEEQQKQSSMIESSRATEAQVIVSVDVATKQTESMESGKEMLAEDSELYAKFQSRRP